MTKSSIGMKKLNLLISIISIASFLISCEKDNETKVNVNEELYNLMQDYYLWYDQLPTVDPNNYSNPIELMDALRVNPPDRWSYVTTKTEQNAYFEEGTYVGFGFASGFNSNGDLIISFVYKSSPLVQYGIGRGWQIVSVNGETPTADNAETIFGASDAGVSKTFVFKSPGGNTVEYTFTKEVISMNTVLLDSVYTFNSTKIGYLVLESFITPTKTELANAFSKFKSENITELIVDLRYNGGGVVDVSRYLANLIGGNTAYGRVYASFYHNDKHSELNSSLLFSVETYSINLNRVVFITSEGTASASELVINGIKPFISEVLVGKKTHGKPVGMYTFTFTDPSIDWAFVPVCFSSRNANDEGDYYDGIPVNIDAEDDVMLPLGDIAEASFNASLQYLGVVTKGISKQNVLPFHQVVGKGLKAEIGAW